MTKQQAFIHNEIWTLTFGAAFQRSVIYKKNATDREKEIIKSNIRDYIETQLIKKYVKHKMSDDEHLKNIYSISKFSKRHSKYLNNGGLNFGVSQKLLNLILKYLWCLGDITTPPHFPVDRRIQEKKNIRPITSWTKYKDHKKYMYVINEVRKMNTEYFSIAELELCEFERRIKTKKIK